MKKLQGIGLLELMLSLAIIAILLVSATRYYTTTRLNEQVNEAAQMVITVYSAGQSWIQSHNDFGSVHMSTFVQDGTVPKDFDDANANPWGGQITANDAGGTNFSAVLEVKMTQVPAAACNNLAAKVDTKIANTTTDCGDPDEDPTTFTAKINMGQ